MTSAQAHPNLLWALLCTSPKRAATVAEQRAVGLPAYRPTWERTPGCPLALDALPEQNAAHWTVETADASPAAFPQELRGRGLHLRAAMTKEGLWKAHGIPIDDFVIHAVERAGFDEYGRPTGASDVATYTLGENLWAEGTALYERALAKLAEAQRAGWPGWEAMGVQVLDVPRREEQ